MALNIKNDEVHRLIEELARSTGETQTMAVRHAVEEKLARVKGQKAERFKKLERIANECASGLKEPYRSMTHRELDEMLYDEKGLPK
jgi:antitoxin VapB